MVVPPAVIFFIKNYFSSPVCMCVCFHIKLKMVLTRSVKNCVEMLMELH